MLNTSHGALQPVEDRFFPRVGLRSPDYDDDDDNNDYEDDDDPSDDAENDDNGVHREKATFVEQGKGVNLSQSHLGEKEIKMIFFGNVKCFRYI